MNALLATLVWALHVAFVVWAVAAPFTNSAAMLVLHLITMPFLWLHWLVNDDTCALTLLERRLRGVECDDSFFHRLVSPVYKISDANVRLVAWAASVGLWLLTLKKVLARPAMVTEVLFNSPRHVHAV